VIYASLQIVALFDEILGALSARFQVQVPLEKSKIWDIYARLAPIIKCSCLILEEICAPHPQINKKSGALIATMHSCS